MLKYVFSLLLCLSALLSLPAGAADPLLPEQAFVLAAPVYDGHALILDYTIAPGYYLYKQRFSFKLQPDAALGAAEFPPGKIKNDPYAGPVEIFHDKLEIRVPVLGKIDPDKVTVVARSQGCAEIGVCYPPYTYRLKLAPAMSSVAPANDDKLDSLLGKKKNPTRLNSNLPTDGSDLTAKASMSWSLLGFLVGGLGLSLTACFYPLIPILSGIVLAGGGGSWRGLFLSLAYTQGVAAVYAVIGAVAGVSGVYLVTTLQSPWLLGGFAVIFVGLALAMFDIIQLQLPTTLQSRFNDGANRFAGGRVLSVFVMGMFSALVVGPCSTPVLVAALGYAQHTASPVLGALTLYALGVGLGLPLLVVGVFGAAVLPHAGPWMHIIRRSYGVVFLSVALFLAQSLLSGLVTMLAWSALAIGTAIFLHALDPLPIGAHALRRLGKALGVMLLLIGAALLIGALAGSRDPLAPLHAFAGTAKAQVLKTWAVVTDPQQLDQQVAQIKGQPLVIDVAADWCVVCREIDNEVLPDVAVQSALAHVITVRFNFTANTLPQRQWLKRYGLFTAPAIFIFDAQGHLRHVFNSKPSASELAQQLKEVA